MKKMINEQTEKIIIDKQETRIKKQQLYLTNMECLNPLFPPHFLLALFIHY
jgi:hypothetical protein